MKRLWLLIALMTGFANVGFAADSTTHTIMRLEPEALNRMMTEHLAMEEVKPSLPPATLPSSVNLSSYISYPVADRDQGSCGDCWTWSGSLAAEITLGVYGVKDALSVQYINSGSANACCGGSTSGFVAWYNGTGNRLFVPRSNTNADFADSTVSCSSGHSSSKVSFSSISTSPHHSFITYTSNQVNTTNAQLNVPQATAISNIKGLLAENHPVIYNFSLPNQTAWNAFDSFWDNGSETSSTFDPSTYNNTYYDPTNGGGHSTLVIGYDDNSSTWIVQNSWGTRSNRPNGTFRLPYNINYNSCLPHSGGGCYWSVYFETISVTFNQVIITLQPQDATVTAGQEATFSVTATSGSSPYRYQWYFGATMADFTAVFGGSGATLTIPNVSSSNAGGYYVIVTDAAGSSVQSDTATLTVNSGDSGGGCMAVNPGLMVTVVAFGAGLWFVLRGRK